MRSFSKSRSSSSRFTSTIGNFSYTTTNSFVPCSDPHSTHQVPYPTPDTRITPKSRSSSSRFTSTIGNFSYTTTNSFVPCSDPHSTHQVPYPTPDTGIPPTQPPHCPGRPAQNQFPPHNDRNRPPTTQHTHTRHRNHSHLTTHKKVVVTDHSRRDLWVCDPDDGW